MFIYKYSILRFKIWYCIELILDLIRLDFKFDLFIILANSLVKNSFNKKFWPYMCKK